jgi:hypothetical protein
MTEEVSKLDQLVDRCDTLVHGIVMNDAEALRMGVWTIAACLDDAKAELLRLRSPTEARGEVKALEWKPASDGVVGRGGGYVYTVKSPNMTKGWRAWVAADGVAMSVGGTVVTMRGKDCDDAIAICEADYSSRILSALSHPPAREAVDDAVVDDPDDEKWNAGVNFAITQLCEVFGVDPRSISWDAATETVEGDVSSVLCNVLRAAYGENWSSNERDTASIRAALQVKP